jgi:hypothetical protein
VITSAVISAALSYFTILSIPPREQIMSRARSMTTINAAMDLNTLIFSNVNRVTSSISTDGEEWY